MTTNNTVWPGRVGIEYKALLDHEARISAKVRGGDSAAALEMMGACSQLELAVWDAWAECTADINPGLVSDMRAGTYMELGPYIRRGLESNLAGPV